MGKLNISLITQYTTTCNLLPHFGGFFFPWSIWYTGHWPKPTFMRSHLLPFNLRAALHLTLSKVPPFGRRITFFSKCVIKGMLSSTPPSPWKWTWNLKITKLQRNIIFEASIFGFHVNLPECNVFLRICQIGSFPQVGVKKNMVQTTT